ncbi:SCO family protein [Candidatus Marinamargulisbacteria bacterium SCGC AG-414-C22]|nr:SCO family protein [Candidatus Marinamargulisbacteria bacterium SCGC AG-414-C22]
MKTLANLLILTLLCSCMVKKDLSKLPYFKTMNFIPTMTKTIDSIEINSFELINQDNQTIDETHYKNKIRLTNFFFTVCQGFCTQLTEHMNVVNNHYLDDPTVHFISHSITPIIDTPEILQSYVTKKELNTQKWNFLTGSELDVLQLAKRHYGVTIVTADEDINHTEKFFLIDPNGYIRGVYNGTLRIESKRIIEHIEKLKKEFKL